MNLPGVPSGSPPDVPHINHPVAIYENHPEAPSENPAKLQEFLVKTRQDGWDSFLGVSSGNHSGVLGQMPRSNVWISD